MIAEMKARSRKTLHRVSDELLGARTYVTSAWGARHLDQERMATAKALAPVEMEIGATAEGANISANLPAMEAVRAARGQIALAEAVVKDRDAAVAAAEDAVMVAAKSSGQAVEAMRPEHEGLVAAAQAARAEMKKAEASLQKIDREIRKVEATMNAPAPAPGAPPVDSTHEAKDALAALRAERGPAEAKVLAARDAYEKADVAAAEKTRQLDAAVRTWKQKEIELAAAVSTAEAERAAAAEMILEHRAALDEAHRELGQAICEAGIRADPLTASLAQAEPLLRQNREAAAVAAELRVRAAYNRKPALRIGIAAGSAALIVVALIVMLIIVL